LTAERHDFPALAPGARFCVRALAAGASLDRVAALLADDLAAVRKHLRVAAAAADLPAPAPDADEGAVRAALDPLLAAARTAVRAPSTRCPAPDVLATLASGGLDGPLLLAELDHVADCGTCLAAVLEDDGPPAAREPEGGSGCLGVLLLLAAGAAGWSVLS